MPASATAQTQRQTPSSATSAVTPTSGGAAEIAEGRAWDVLLRLASLHLDGKEAGAPAPSAADFSRMVAEADEVLKAAPPTDFALVSVASHTMCQRGGSTEEAANAERPHALVLASPPPSSQAAPANATLERLPNSRQRLSDIAQKELISRQRWGDILVEDDEFPPSMMLRASPARQSSRAVDAETVPRTASIARRRVPETGGALHPVGTVISLANCLKLPERSPAVNPTSSSAGIAHMFGGAGPAVMSPRTAAARAAQILLRYQHVVSAAGDRAALQRFQHVVDAAAARGACHAEASKQIPGDVGATVGDSSSTGGSCNLEIGERSVSSGAAKTCSAMTVTSILEKYRDIIDVSTSSPIGGLHGRTPSTGGCKSPATEHIESCHPVDAGSGGTADALTVDPAEPVEPAHKSPLDGSVAVVGSDSSGGTGESDVDEFSPACAQKSASHTIASGKLGPSAILTAASPTEGAVGMPWTFSYFFEDEGCSSMAH